MNIGADVDEAEGVLILAAVGILLALAYAAYKAGPAKAGAAVAGAAVDAAGGAVQGADAAGMTILDRIYSAVGNAAQSARAAAGLSSDTSATTSAPASGSSDNFGVDPSGGW
jgi:hypothetical protein